MFDRLRMRKVHQTEDPRIVNLTVKKHGIIQFDLNPSGDWIIVALWHKWKVLELVICVVYNRHPVAIRTWMDSSLIQTALESNYITMETEIEMS